MTVPTQDNHLSSTCLYFVQGGSRAQNFRDQALSFAKLHAFIFSLLPPFLFNWNNSLNIVTQHKQKREPGNEARIYKVVVMCTR